MTVVVVEAVIDVCQRQFTPCKIPPYEYHNPRACETPLAHVHVMYCVHQ